MQITKTLSGQTKTLTNRTKIFCTGYDQTRKNFQELQKLLNFYGWQKYSHSVADTNSFYMVYSKGDIEITIRISDHTKPSFVHDDGYHVFIDTWTNEIEILCAEEYQQAVEYIKSL